MNTSLNRQPFLDLKLDEILAFTSQFQLTPFHDSSLISRFLTDFISSEKLVFDIFQEKERVAVAVLLDGLKNGANSANLEIVGLNTKADANSIFTMILNYSKESLPSFRDAIDINYYESFPVSSSLLIANGFKFSYSMYDMITSSPRIVGTQMMPSFSLSRLTEVDFEEYHSVVMKAFEKNEDTNIPPLKEMWQHLLKAKLPPTILRKNDSVIGFFSLNIDDSTPNSGVVNTLGLLPDYRGIGLGRLLLNDALIQLCDCGVKTFKLAVSAKNEKALSLYHHFGFEVHEKSSVFRWQR